MGVTAGGEVGIPGSLQARILATWQSSSIFNHFIEFASLAYYVTQVDFEIEFSIDFLLS